MLQDYYFKDETKNVTIAFLDMFNAIKVYRHDKAGNVVKIIDVPVKFGPAEKYYLFQAQRESGKKYYPTLPSIQVELTSLSYDPDRATGVNELRQFYDPMILSASDDFWSDVQPTPYNFNFTVQIKTESLSDISQILENILPGFNPALQLRVKEFSFMNIERNLKVVHNGDVPLDYPQEMTEEDHRYINTNLNFTVYGYLYRPISKDYIIKYIKTNYIYSGDGTSTVISGTSVDDVVIERYGKLI